MNESAATFARVGQALFGTGQDWKAQFAKALGIKPDSVDAMSKGHSKIPEGVFLDIAGLLQDRKELLGMLKFDVLNHANTSIITCSFTELRTSGHRPITKEPMLTALKSEFETLLRRDNIKHGYLHDAPSEYWMVIAAPLTPDRSTEQSYKLWLGAKLDELNAPSPCYPTSAEGTFYSDAAPYGFQQFVPSGPKRR